METEMASFASRALLAGNYSAFSPSGRQVAAARAGSISRFLPPNERARETRSGRRGSRFVVANFSSFPFGRARGPKLEKKVASAGSN